LYLSYHSTIIGCIIG